MTAEAILTPVITEELGKYEGDGKKIKLKTAEKRKVTYSIICGIIALCGLAHPVYLLVIPIYLILMRNASNKVKVILSVAKKNPNKPVDQIIAEEIVCG